MVNHSKMPLLSCFHPKVVFNNYIGDEVVSACGKCEACRNNRASNWVKRLDLEASAHKFVLFTTLTYDEQHVPQIVRVRFEDYEPSNHLPAYLDSETGELIDTSEIKATFTKKDKDYVNETKVINRLQKRDFQLFLKRLRYYFDKTTKGAKLRYYLCGELGPRTYRPHGHVLLFFDDSRCASQIEKLLSLSWVDDKSQPLGNIYDPHFVSGSAASYCASYINSVTSLPRVYLHQSLMPFTIFSKAPSIGSLSSSVPTAKELFIRKDTSIRFLEKSRHEFIDVPLWRSLKDRLYPRLPRFNQLSHDDRIELYRFVESEKFEDSKTFESVIHDRYCLNPNNITFIGRYFYEISHKYKSVLQIDTNSFIGAEGILGTLPFLPSDDDIKFFQSRRGVFKRMSREYNANSLIRFFRLAKLAVSNASDFGLSIEDYVTKIEEFYDSLSTQNLNKWLQFQDEFFKSHSLDYLPLLDYSLYNNLKLKDVSTLSSSYKSLFFNIGLTLEDAINTNTGLIYKRFKFPEYTACDSYTSYVLRHRVVSQKLNKTKYNNDYALAKKDRFNNIINYQIK